MDIAIIVCASLYAVMVAQYGSFPPKGCIGLLEEVVFAYIGTIFCEKMPTHF